MTENPSDTVDLGYDPGFLAFTVPVPEVGEAISGDVLTWEGGTVLPYTHFSLAMSVSRRFAYWVAWNIDGSALRMNSRSGLDFILDPRIPSDAQTGNELYEGNRLDRGHLARRADVIWGEAAEAQQANEDSFHYTNITPQMDDFNQSTKQGLWGRLENALYEDVDVDDLKASVMAGPVFRSDDQVYRCVGIPREYWKVLAYSQGSIPKVRAFLLTQDLDQLQVLMALDEFRVYQVTLSELEERTGLRYPAALHDAEEPLTVARDTEDRQPLADTSEIQW